MGSNGVLDANTLSKLQAGGPQIPQETLSRLTPQPRNTGGDPEIARRLDQMHASRPSTPQPGDVSPEQLQRIVGSGMSPDRAQQLAPHLNNAMREAGITTDRQKAAFISQLAHESGGFRHFEELASGRAYEGRRDLGNTQAGDGERFKGRGPIQLTGRANYQAAGRALGLDLENNPDLVSRPDVGFRVAAWYWNSRNINQTADRGDFVGVTRAINGGTNGLDDRMRYYERALGALA
ncbi:MAG: glycoside hydrolase family 19 protein [Deltaproteobacteria bacterium]|nr:glycoside hydrolase family 19 protein [Deltaproteobacteria bacterium]